MAKLSPSTLNRILEELDTYELGNTKKACIRELVTAELARKDGADRFQEFHKWIKQGDTILTQMLEENRLLKEMTAPDAELVSKAEVLHIIEAFATGEPQNDHEKGANWCAGKIKKAVESLPAVKK